MHAMKKIILSTIFCVAIAGFASAQTLKSKSSKTTTYTSTTSHKAKKQSRKKSSARIDTTNNTATIPDNRKEYMKDGQLATRTGHEAAPTNGEQFQSIKDSANKKRKKQ
jgi:hypothetical protein